MRKYHIKYYFCANCGFLQTESPYWLEEAYKESINQSDTGILIRNQINTQKASVLLYFIFGHKGRYLDYGGGYGIFVRMMRDIGFNFFLHEPFTKNIFSKGFTGALSDKYDCITSFETFEHFISPLQEINKLLTMTDTLLFSTQLYGMHPPKPEKWDYYGLDHGQHVSFFNLKTLHYLASRFNLNLWSDKKYFHILSRRKIVPQKVSLVYSLAKWGLALVVARKMSSLTLKDANEDCF